MALDKWINRFKVRVLGNDSMASSGIKRSIIQEEDDEVNVKVFMAVNFTEIALGMFKISSSLPPTQNFQNDWYYCMSSSFFTLIDLYENLP
jgi:hypothetical protein